MTLFPSLRDQGMIAVDCETYDPQLTERGPGVRWGAYIVGVAVATEAGFNGYYPIAHKGGPNLPKDKVIGWLKRELASPVPKVGANILYDMDFLAAEGIELQGPLYDVQLAEPLIDENQFSYSLETLAKKYLRKGKYESKMIKWICKNFNVKPNKAKFEIWRTPPEIVEPYAIADVVLPIQIFQKQKRKLEQLGLWELFELEISLIPMLLAMRQRGVRVDVKAAHKLYDDLAAKQVAIVKNIKRSTGVELQPWAASSIQKIFDHHGLEYPRTPKTKAPSFTKVWLEHHKHPVAQKIQEVRSLDKLKETFIKGFIIDGNHRGRIYCQFHQLRGDDNGTVTGRFSCVAAWTPIKTQRGNIMMADVRVGDQVWTHKNRWRTVTATLYQGREQTFNVYLSNGNVLTCTKEHRVLLQSEQWITIGELHEHFKNMDTRSGCDQGRSSLVPDQGIKRLQTNCDRTEYDGTERAGCAQSELIQEGAQSAFNPTILSRKDRTQEPDVRKDCRAAPQLERSMRRSQGLSNNQAEWQTHIHASPYNVAETGPLEATSGLCDSPYRRRPSQQRPRQSGNLHKRGAQNYSCLAASWGQSISITAIEDSRSIEVFDLTVTEDESYETCGVFSHNCSNPNLQQIPVRSDIGKLIRAIFLPDTKKKFGKADYCVAPETRILTTDMQHLRADQIMPGMELVGFDEHCKSNVGKGKGSGNASRRRLRKTKVLYTKRLRQPCYRITTDRGEFTSSAKHRWLAKDKYSSTYKWQQTDALKPGSMIPRVFNVWDTRQDYEAGWMAGFLDGEGYLSHNGLGFGQNEGPCLQHARTWLEKNNYTWREDVVQKSLHQMTKVYIQGGRHKAWELVGSIRPKRLLPKISKKLIDNVTLQSRTMKYDTVVSIEFIGEQEVIAIQTEHKTFIANGLASHNSQIEYRLMAHDAAELELPGSAAVVEAYQKDDADFHAIIAEMTGLSRYNAKTINFGIAYGEGLAKLCAALGLTLLEGKKFMANYHKRAPFMKPLMQTCMRTAQREGEIRTLFNRIRHFDKWETEDISGKHHLHDHQIPGAQRAFTYAALNARIQGSAADILKLAMRDVWRSGVCDVLGAPHMVVHDEIDISVPDTKIGREAFKEMTRLMENCVQLRVPLKVDAGLGPNWGSIK